MHLNLGYIWIHPIILKIVFQKTTMEFVLHSPWTHISHLDACENSTHNLITRISWNFCFTKIVKWSITFSSITWFLDYLHDFSVTQVSLFIKTLPLLKKMFEIFDFSPYENFFVLEWSKFISECISDGSFHFSILQAVYKKIWINLTCSDGRPVWVRTITPRTFATAAGVMEVTQKFPKLLLHSSTVLQKL